jgi:hypothetical protein
MAITAIQAAALRQAFVAEYETAQGPQALSDIYSLIEQWATVGQNHCEAKINPILKTYLMNQLNTDGYTIRASQDGTSIYISWA